MDTFTCGSCCSSFTDLQEFLHHKKTRCWLNAELPHPTPSVKVTRSCSRTSAAENERISDVIADTDLPPVTHQAILDQVGDVSSNAKAAVQHGNKDLPEPETEEGTIFLCKDCNVYATHMSDLTRHHSEVHNTPQDSAENIIVTLQPLSGARTLKTGSVKPVQIVQTVKRKRGRPSKYAQVKKIGQVQDVEIEELRVVPAVEEDEKMKGEDGGKMPHRKRGRPRKTQEDKELEKKRLIEWMEEEERKKLKTTECQSCGKAFARLRQLTSHRCQADNPDHESRSDTEDDEDDSIPQTTSIDDPSSADHEPVKPESLHDLESILDGLHVPEHEIPQSLNDKAIPDLRVNKSGSLKVYPCLICKTVFKTKSCLVIHLGKHSNNKPFKCTECIYSSKFKSNLKSHMKKHSNERLQCDVCSYSCINKWRLKAHKKKHGPKRTPIYCNLCKCQLYTTAKLLRHLEADHDVETDQKAKSYYEEQKLQCRTGQRNLIYQCHICNRKFKDRGNHDKHLILHQPCKPLKCTVCPYTAFRFTAIEKHAQRHWFIYICHLCKTKVLSLELLKAHLTSHHLSDGVSASDFLESSINVSMYQSDSIEKELVNELNRKNERHLEDSQNPSPVETTNLENQCEMRNGSAHFEILNTAVVDKSELQEIGEAFTKRCFKRLSLVLLGEIRALYGDSECPICGRLFSYQPHMEAHKKTHQDEKDFKCELCSYSSHTKQGLKRHIDTVHVRTNLTCPICDFKTTSTIYLRAHMKKHQGSQIFKCTQCDLSAANEDEMKRHIVTNHPELPRSELEKIMGKHIHIRNKMGKIASHRCQHCGQVFRRLCDLRRHIWLHNGINPYKCKLCKYETRNLSNLKSHMVRHSDTKNHLCDECGKMFKMKSALKVHRNAQHPTDKLHCCSHCEFTTNKECYLKRHMDTHIQTPVQTFRCYQCTQYSSDKDSLREHYRVEHPDTAFDETLSYKIPEERITTLNISINHKDGVLHYKCSQCDVILVNNGELGEHLRETHGLAITTSMHGDGGTDPEQLGAENLGDQTDLTTLPEGLEVHMVDAMNDERTGAMQLLQHIIDIQTATSQNDGSMTEPSQQQYTMERTNQDEHNDGMSETVAAVDYLTASESLSDVHDGMQHSEQNLQAVESCHPHNGSSEVIPDAVFEQEVIEGVTVELKGQMTYILPEQQAPSL